MPDLIGKAKRTAQGVASWAGQTAASGAVKLLHGYMGNALADWIEETGQSAIDIDRAFKEGKAHELLKGAFGVVRPEDIERFRAQFGAVAAAFSEEDFGRILDAAATHENVLMQVDVIGKLHWDEYVRIMNDLKWRFLNGLPLV